MNALIGGPANGDGVEEMAAFRQTGGNNQDARQSSRGTAPKEVDISTMTAAETAKMLSEKSRNSGPNNSNLRYRSKTKVLAHHQLLNEELSKQQEKEQQEAIAARIQASKVKHDESDSDNDDDDGFVREKRSTQAAVVISRGSSKMRRRRRYNSSSSSSSSSSSDEGGRSRRRRHEENRKNRRDRRRNGEESSSSSSSDEEDRRRNQRVLASRRKQEEPETIIPKLNVNSTEVKKEDSAPAKEKPVYQEDEGAPVQQSRAPEPMKLAATTRGRYSSDNDAEDSGSSSSSDSDSSSSSSSDSSSSSSSEDDEEPIRLKPVFVPKHKRNLVQSEEKKLEEEELKFQLEKERKFKKKAESRALVAKELALAESSLQNEADDDNDEEMGGTTNAPPNDDDELDKDRERNAWEIREIERLLKSIDELELRRKEEEEYSRRRKLTDAECLKEDIESGRYQAPGANRDRSKMDEQNGSGHLKRFFHRGAYYMDESEWDEGDIRLKAQQYAQSATGEDKIDKSKLPEVMQVKNFGRARQNTKYKGLAKEDTTDRSAQILPLQMGKRAKR